MIYNVLLVFHHSIRIRKTCNWSYLNTVRKLCVGLFFKNKSLETKLSQFYYKMEKSCLNFIQENLWKSEDTDIWQIIWYHKCLQSHITDLRWIYSYLETGLYYHDTALGFWEEAAVRRKVQKGRIPSLCCTMLRCL